MSNTYFSSDAELAIINIILNHPDTIYSIPSLKSFMFSSSGNQLLFSTIQEITQNNSVPEFNLVAATLDSKGKLNDVGGLEYLKIVRDLTYSKDNIKEYESHVKSGYRARELLAISAGLNSRITGGEDSSIVLQDLRKHIEKIDETSGGEQVVDIMTASMDMWNQLKDRIANPGIRGIPTGFSSIDVHTGGYNKGDLVVIAGRPSMGKTAVMCNSAIASAEYLRSINSNESVQIFSLEMNKISLIERMVSIVSGVPLADIRIGVLSQQQLDEVSSALKYLKDLPIYIDTNFDANEMYFSATVRKYHKLKGLRLVFFDYIQLASERENNQTSEIGRFTRAAKLLANDLGITTVLFSQLNRGVEMREDKRPVLSDLRQSGNIEEDADIVTFLYRDDYYNSKSERPGELEQIIRKHRNGATGTLFFNFDQTCLKIV